MRNPEPMDYPLPHHVSLVTLDPLDVCGDTPEYINNDGFVQHRHVTEALLKHADHDLSGIETRSQGRQRDWASRFGILIQDIAYSLHNVGDLDTGLLEALLEDQPIEILVQFRQSLFLSARLLEAYFPTAELDFLSDILPSCSFTPTEIDVLLSHLLLGTVQIPRGNEWGRPGFTALYRASPAVPSAVTGYLRTLIDHFAKGGYGNTVDEQSRFMWRYSTTSVDITSTALSIRSEKATRITPVVKSIASEPTQSASASTFVLLSAHSQPGPGPAGTHEERLMGQSPALAATSLICPKLAPNVALVTSAFPLHAEWEGHNRYAKLTKLYQPNERAFRRYIIADAAELDVAEHGDVLPDLKPGVIEREVGKLEAGFGGCVRLVSEECISRGKTDEADSEKTRIEVVPWGCQAFGGNLVIKAQCMMMAGGLAGVEEIHLLVSSDRKSQTEEINGIVEKGLTVGDIYKSLRK